MADFVKHRQEREVYAVDFARLLSPDETLASAAVTVTPIGSAVDRTVQFRDGEPGPVISGTEVQFWLKAAAEGEQAAGDYDLLVKATTSKGRVLVALRSGHAPVRLTVVDRGDVA